MTSKQIVIMEELKEIAKLSNMRCKHAAAIVDSKNNIICTGFNHYVCNHTCSRKDRSNFSIHAEKDVLRKCNMKDISGCNMYIIRSGCDNPVNTEFKYSAPCKQCTALINTCIAKYKLNKVYYSLDSDICNNRISLKCMNECE